MSFFRTTRIMHLDERKDALKIKTKSGKKLKKSLNSDDWQKVSDSIGKTSWMCLLYRKRIQSNYRNIDTFLSPEFDVGEVLEGLVSFTHVINLTNEINIANHIGATEIRKWIPRGIDFVCGRIDFIDDLTKNDSFS